VELLKIAFEIGSYMSRFCFAIFRNPTTLYNRIASMEWWDYWRLHSKPGCTSQYL